MKLENSASWYVCKCSLGRWDPGEDPDTRKPDGADKSEKSLDFIQKPNFRRALSASLYLLTNYVMFQAW